MAIKSQWSKRVEVFQFIYSCLILDLKGQEIVDTAVRDYNFDANQLQIAEYIRDCLDDIVKNISKFLQKKWPWNRLPYVDRAIFIQSYAEYVVLGTERNIIIDQAVITARNYSEEDNWKYINAILDKVLI